MQIEDPCPECRSQLSFDEVDIGVGTLRGNPHCDVCYWSPDAVRVACECGCGRMSFNSAMEFNHPTDYRYE